MAELNGVLMQFFHWYIAPDGNLWNELKEKSQELFDAGITAVWIPPAYKGHNGGSDVGYAVYDLYDLGEFDQKKSVRTKYGTKDELISAVQTAKSAGIQVYADIVLNHMIGGDAEEEIIATPCNDSNRHERIGETRTIKAYTHFHFPGRQGKYWPMEWHWWHFTAVDTDGNDPDYKAVFLFDGKVFDEKVDLERGSYDYLMGCDIDVKQPEVQETIKNWGAWFYDQIGFDGVRFDAVKHVEAGFFPQWLNHVRAHSKQRIFALGEYWSYNVEALHEFIAATGGDVALFDAPLHFNFSVASKSGNEYDMRQIFDNTLVKNEPGLAITIVENHDTQPLQSLESVVEGWFKPLAYALILLRKSGYPCLFYADYYGADYKDKGPDGNDHEIHIASHRWLIDKFLAVRKLFAYGEQYDYFDHPNTIGWTRLGIAEHPGGACVVLTNSDAGSKRMQTVPDTTYYDITEHVEGTVTSDGEGWGDFRCAERSVSVWVPVVAN